MILLLVTAGLTLASMNGGNQGGAYYAIALTSAVLAVASLIRHRLKATLLPGLYGILLIFFIFSLQGLLLPPFAIDFEFPQSALRVGSIVIIFLICMALANADSKNVETAFLVSWVAMFAILIYGIIAGGALRIEFGIDRFSGAGFREVIWSEIALGTLVLAFLTRRHPVFLLTLPFVGLIVFATQMRVAGLAVFFGVLVYVADRYFFQKGRAGRMAFLAAGIVAIFSFVVFFEAISQLVRLLLLLDHSHRGLESGFSGRFENIAMGWHAYLASPLIGFGLEDETVNYTHNSFVLVMAQYGIFGIFWCCLVLYSMLIAFRQRDLVLLSCLIVLTIYYMAQPRHINFQVFPFVGVLSVFLALASRPQPSLIRCEARKKLRAQRLEPVGGFRQAGPRGER